MPTPTTDLMMQFLAVGTGAITAGASGAMTKGDSLSQDFKPDKYFEVETFDFDLELKDDEGDRYKPVPTTAIAEAPGAGNSFARWRAVKPGAGRGEGALPVQAVGLLHHPADRRRVADLVQALRDAGKAGRRRPDQARACQ